jgi:signal transduction histidine kinase
MSNSQISFFNFSLSKLLAKETDHFISAKIKIVYTVLVFSLLKAFLVSPLFFGYLQTPQILRGAILFSFYFILLKLFLARKLSVFQIGHFLTSLGVLVIYTNIFVFAKSINIISLQFLFSIFICSFFLFDKKFGFFYSVIASIPLLLKIGTLREGFSSIDYVNGTILSPFFEIIVILNLITLIVIIYLFQDAFVSNVKEKQLLNDKLIIANQEANLAAKSKIDFLSTMSHELRTPLNSVIGITDLLLVNPTGNEQKENLESLKFSAVSLNSLVNDILDFNKLGFEQIKLEKVSINLFQMVTNICSGFNHQAKKKGIDLALYIDDGLKNVFIKSDPTRISQILYNLIGNAIKFTHDGLVTVSLKLLDRDHDYINVQFEVTDTGIGIAKEKLETIFEPFKQASESTTRKFGGTGLGLAIVKKLIHLFGAEVKLESTLNQGSKFYFDIEFEVDHNAATSIAIMSNEVLDLSHIRVLAAEDNPMNRLVLKKVFEKWNNHIVFAEDGQEAIDKLLLQEFDLILMDLHMPVLDGYQASLAIRDLPDKTKSQIQIIALTASVSSNLDEKIKAAKMNDFILKPFNANEMYSKLKALRFDHH